MKKISGRKFLSIVSAWSLLINQFLPFASVLIVPVHAQEQVIASPTPEPTSLPEASIVPSPGSALSPSPSLDPSPSATASAEIIVPSPSPELSPSPTPASPNPETQSSEPPKENSPPSDAAASAEASPSISPIPSPLPAPNLNEQLQIAIIDNTASASIDEFDLTVTESGSAQLVTDKLDYAPTDTALITGSSFLTNTTYSLTISSSDDPATSTTVDITTDAAGTLFYAYQLDGNYRPNYKVEAFLGEVLVATTTFTDSASPAIVWPTSWTTPNSCVSDPINDENPNNIDLTGSTGSPAVGFGSDSNYQYFREKVHGNPGSASNPVEKAWVVLFQTSSPEYQYLGSLNGKDDKVQLWQNTTPDGAVDFSPLHNDPAETLRWERSSADYARITSAAGGDYYVDWAISLSELSSRGITLSTTKFFATSADENNFNKDHLKCYEQFADLSVIKSDSPDPVISGGTLTYTLSVHNAGPDSATDVIVTDTLPVGYSVTSVTPSQGSCSDQTAPDLQCELGTMVNGADAIVTIIGTLTGTGTVTNNTSVTLDTTVSIDLNLSNNTDSEDTTINPAKGHLIVQKTTIPAGDLTSFAINATGSGTITGGSTGSITDASDNDYEVTAGTYWVTETVPSGWSQTGNTCQEVAVAAGQSAECTVTNTKLRDITACKFDDVNGDGQRQETEPWLSGWEMILAPGDLAQTTGENGCTTFSNLLPGEYSVAETLKDDWSNTTPLSQNISLTADQNESVTFGNFACAAISGSKWEDLNGDGIKDSGEPYLADWTINVDGPEDDSIATNADGNYSFKVCQGGSYTVSESLTDSAWYQTYPGGASPIHQVEVSSGGRYTGNDFGNARYAKIFGVKYRDNDGNGQIDGDDLTDTLSGWVINLYDGATGAVLGTYTTLADGYYEFTGLLVNKTYYVLEQFQIGWRQTYGPTASPSPSPFTIQSGEVKGVDFANFELGRITACKYNDANGNGSYDTQDDQPLANINIILTQGEIVLDSQETGRDGCVIFGGLVAGTYRVAEDYTDPDLDGYYSTNSITYYDVDIVSGSDETRIFLNALYRTISGYKYNDLNGNGSWDDGEPGLENWTIFIDYNNNGDLDGGEPFTTTDADGYYEFTGLVSDSYTIAEVLETGWAQTEPASGHYDADVHTALTSTDNNFGNQVRGSVTIIKDSIPNHEQDFAFTSPQLGGFTLDDDINATLSNTEVFSDLGSNTYEITESTISGWTLTDLSCTGDDNVQIDLIGRTATIALDQPGETVTCTFTNSKLPQLTVTKLVTNDNGGTKQVADFPLFVDGSGVTSGATNTYQPDNYLVTETEDSGYAATFGGSCDETGNVSLAYGDDKTCTITNDDIAPTLKLVKTVDTRDGGNELADDWTLYATASTPDDSRNFNNLGGSGSFQSVFANVDYVLSESTIPGYLAGSWSCEGGSLAGDTVTLGLDEEVTCTIINDDVAPTITLIKEVVGGSAAVSDFSLYLGGKSVTSGNANSVLANSPYDVDEDGPSGYSFTSIIGDPKCPEALRGDIEADEGENITCTITNTRDTGTITVDKVTDPSGSPEAFTINLNQGLAGEPTLIHSSVLADQDTPDTYTLPTGEYWFQELDQAGWSLTEATCTDGEISFDPRADSFNLTKDANLICTFTNTELGNVTVVKYNDLNGNGTQDETEPTMDNWEIWLNDMAQWTGNGDPAVAGQVIFSDLLPGQYALSEQPQAGWEQTGSSCGSEINLTAGQDLTCYIGNQGRGTITVIKDVVPDSSATFDFSIMGSLIETIGVTLGDGGSSSYNDLPADTYNVSETANSLYATSVECISSFEDTETADAVILSPGETVTCTFTNTRNTGNLVITKLIDADGDLETTDDRTPFEGWVMDIDPDGADTDDPSIPSTDDSGQTGASDIRTGNYWVVEDPDGPEDNYHFLDSYCQLGETPTGNSGTSSFGGVEVASGQTTNCTFVNARDTGTVTVIKNIDGNNDDDLEDDVDQTNVGGWTWDIDGGEQNITMGDSRTLVTGGYSLSEDEQAKYVLAGWSCDNNTSGSNNDIDLTVNVNDQITCQFTNVPLTDIHGYKWEDINGDGQRDEGENLLGDWTIFLDSNGNGQLDEGESSTQTATEGKDLGWYWFMDLLPGNYRICEVAQSGWEQTYPLDPNCHEVTLPESGEQTENRVTAVEHNFGNQSVPATLEISKSNDAVGDETPGGSVLYTITLRVLGNNAFNVLLTDLLPKGFKYRVGSWSATRNGLPFSISEPTYASPGVWDLGDLAKDDLVELTLIADISGDQKGGLYKDLAWAYGCQQDAGCEVSDTDAILAMAGEANFVGTQVNVVKDTQNNAQIEVKGEVLGASTELPATGSATGWLILALLMLITGTGSVLTARKLRRYHA